MAGDKSGAEKQLRIFVMLFMAAVAVLMAALLLGSGLMVAGAFLLAALGALMITVKMRDLYCYKGISGTKPESVPEEDEEDSEEDDEDDSADDRERKPAPEQNPRDS
ncbi:hypothetical protein [Succinimonas sp.]|uniref:hypothetical protein n=1 Tax=Succinimonas sp. TaxID=1936151 RepID=UPI0038692146